MIWIVLVFNFICICYVMIKMFVIWIIGDGNEFMWVFDGVGKCEMSWILMLFLFRVGKDLDFFEVVVDMFV